MDDVAAGDAEQHAAVPSAEAVAEMLLTMLARTHLTSPADLAATVAEQVRVAGGDGAVIYLADHEQRTLVPVPAAPAHGIATTAWDGLGAPASDAEGHGSDESAYVAARAAEPVAIQGTVGGRCFTTTQSIEVAGDTGAVRRLWVPLMDGTDRVGVLALTVPAGPDGVPAGALRVWERFAHLVAQLVASKDMYGDTFELLRRSRPMSLAAELQLALLPPPTFASRGLVLSAIREPCYGGGGDAFDYSVDTGVLTLVIIDAMGHGLAASGGAALTLAACRQARRMGLDLGATYVAVDGALTEQFGGERFATGVVAKLDLVTGLLSWISAGHPEPLVLRGGRFVKTLSTSPSTPFGLGFSGDGVTIGTEQLEPGDRVLLYTDGLPEARQPDGSFFGIDRLVDFLERAAQDGYAAPETLRRLREAVLQHQHGDLQDDATALLVEWRGGTEEALLPATVSLRG